MRYVLVEPPEPLVTVAEANAQGITGDDGMVEALVAAATTHLDGRDGILGRALVNQTWRLDRYGPDGCGRIKIDMPNVSSIESVEYLSGGSYETWSDAEYRLGSVGNFFFVAPKSGFSWPSTDDQEDAIRITFVTGFGEPADVPSPIRQAVILLARHLSSVVGRDMFLARHEVPGVLTRQFVVSEAAGGVVNSAVNALVRPYRMMTV